MAYVRDLKRVASSYASKAVEFDRKGMVEEAIRMYGKAIEVLGKLLTLDPGLDFNKDVYRRKIAAYKKRIEELKNMRAIPRLEVELEADEPVEPTRIGLGPSKPGEEGEKKRRERPPISWDDIVGLEEAKRAIKEAIIYPIMRPDLFPLGWPRGILLFGPPGCGKTLLASAVAYEVDAEFIEVSGADIMSKWLGEAEKNVAKLFARAREVASSGRPAIIFIDEVDSLFGTFNNEVGGEIRVRNQFLREMDGILDKTRRMQVYVIGATNKPWAIDPPFIRRFQKRILVPPPDFEARIGLFKLYTRDMKLASDVDFEELAHLTRGYTGNDIKDICMDAYYSAIRDLFETGEALRPGSKPRPVARDDFIRAIRARRPSITPSMVRLYYDWYEKFRAL